jgi:hypothetical protein
MLLPLAVQASGTLSCSPPPGAPQWPPLAVLATLPSQTKTGDASALASSSTVGGRRRSS